MQRDVPGLHPRSREAESEPQRLARLNGSGQLRQRQRSIVLVLIARRDGPERRLQVDGRCAVGSDDLDACNVGVTKIIGVPFGDGVVTRQPALLHPGRLAVAERVPIEVQAQGIGGDRPGVAPGDGFAAGQRPRAQLERGKRAVEVLKQLQYAPVKTEHQVVTLYALTKGYMDDVPLNRIKEFEQGLMDYTEKNAKAFYQEVTEQKMWTDKGEEALKKAITDFKTSFK